jgi:small nuclear ribonucleoprotein (snRNP)-like protein
MDAKIIKELIGKKVFIKTTSGRNYSATINNVDNEVNLVNFVYITDKYNNLVILNAKEIEVLEVQQ